MKIELLKEQNVPMPKGSVIDIDEARAKWLVNVGAAKFVELPKPKKKTTKKKKD